MLAVWQEQLYIYSKSFNGWSFPAVSMLNLGVLDQMDREIMPRVGLCDKCFCGNVLRSDFTMCVCVYEPSILGEDRMQRFCFKLRS